MDAVNFPGIIAKHNLLKTADLSLADDLLLIGKKMGKQRNGTQYENMVVTLQELANLIAIAGGNETLAQTLVLGSVTGGNNIVFSGTDAAVFNSGLFQGTLSRAALSANRAWNLPNQSGTIALLSDIPAAATTLYSGDGSTPGARTVTLGGTLQFNHGAAGVNGYVQTASGGYFRNQTSIATNYWEYSNVSGVMLFNTDTHSVTGVRANNDGGAGNPTALVEMFAGSNGTAYFNVGPTTSRLDFYVNNTGKYAGGILGGSAAFNGSWGFGTQPTTAAKVHILGENGQGAGTIIQSMNLSPAESILQVRDAANVVKLNVSATGITYISDRSFIGYNVGSIVTGAAVAIKGSDSSVLSTHTELFDGSNNQLWVMMNNGNVGHNISATALDRMYIRAGANYDGAINISAHNLNTNGYAILAQGGSGGANYNGIWSIALGGTGTIRGFTGAADYNGSTTNHGGYFSARNGSSESIGVVGVAIGGDAVAPGFAAIGVQGYATATLATNRRGGHFYVSGNVNNGLSYGVKTEVDASGTNGVNYGFHSRINGAGASVVNYAGFFQADGGSSATNYALVTNGGNIGFGTITPSQQVLLHLVTTDKAPVKLEPMTVAQAGTITPENGMLVHVSDTDGTFPTIGVYSRENGAWVKL